MKNLKIKQTKGPIPFKGFIMNFFGIILTRSDVSTVNKFTINHEGIHSCQAEDFCKIPVIGFTIFYIWYFIEWLIRFFIAWFVIDMRPYRSMSFEQEAYLYEKDFEYQEKRKRFAWLKYLFKK